MKKHQSITSLPPAPADERRSRMVKYSVAMAIRLVCILLCFAVPGWWVLVPAIGAITLPYIAVVLANAKLSPAADSEVLRPGAVVPVVPGPAAARPGRQQDADGGYRPTEDGAEPSEHRSDR